MSIAIFSAWIVLLIVLHLDRKVMFSDGALAPFRFCDASVIFALILFFFGALWACGVPCVLGLPPGVGRVGSSCVFVGGVGPYGRLGQAGRPPICSRVSFAGVGSLIGVCSSVRSGSVYVF